MQGCHGRPCPSTSPGLLPSGDRGRKPFGEPVISLLADHRGLHPRLNLEPLDPTEFSGVIRHEGDAQAPRVRRDQQIHCPNWRSLSFQGGPDSAYARAATASKAITSKGSVKASNAS